MKSIDEILMEHHPPKRSIAAREAGKLGGRGKKSETKKAKVATWVFGKSRQAAEVVEVPVQVDAATRAFLKREYGGVDESRKMYAYFERLYGSVDRIVIEYGGG